MAGPDICDIDTKRLERWGFLRNSETGRWTWGTLTFLSPADAVKFLDGFFETLVTGFGIKKGLSMKNFVVVVALLFTVSCAGMTAVQTADTIANTSLVMAEQYYAANKADFSAEDAAQFEKFLAGFKLAIATGENIQASVDQWKAFLGE